MSGRSRLLRKRERMVEEAREAIAAGCECGASAFCLPPLGFGEEWQAFWREHPARASIRPLSVEASRRRGGRR